MDQPDKDPDPDTLKLSGYPIRAHIKPKHGMIKGEGVSALVLISEHLSSNSQLPSTKKKKL
ncbi:hypothetical protein YC2023_057837 [Brassica napus]